MADLTTVQVRRTVETRDVDDITAAAGTIIRDDRVPFPDDVCVLIEIDVPADEDGTEPFRFAVPWSVALTLKGRIELAVQEATRLRMAIADGDAP